MSEDLTQKLPAPQNGTLAQILAAVQNLGTRMESLETRLGNLERRIESLETRLESLEKKVEERLYDTRPIWEKAVADIARLQADITEVKQGQQRLQEEVKSLGDRLEKELRDMNRKFSVLNDSMLQMQADYRYIDRRLLQLEEQRT